MARTYRKVIRTSKKTKKTKKTTKEMKKTFEDTYGVPYDLRVKNLNEGDTEW